MTVVRVWRGLTKPGKAPDYSRHLERRVFPELAELAGHRGAFLLKREAEAGTEVLAVTLWDSLDSVKAFAGEDPGRAVVEPEAQALMLAFDERAEHYEVVLAMNAGLPAPGAGAD